MASGTATEQLDRIEELVKAQKQQDLDIWIAHNGKIDEQLAQGEITNARLQTVHLDLVALQEFLDANLPGITFYLGNLQYPVLQAIQTAVELLNSNSSLNAQNAQTLQISGSVACCEDIEFTDNIPADLCQRAQALANRMKAVFTNLASFSDRSTVPTRTDIRNIYSFPDWDLQTPFKISDQEVVILQGELLQLGLVNLGLLDCLASDDTFFASIVNAIYNAGSPQQALASIQDRALDIGECDENVRDIVAAAFSASLLNFTYQPASTMGQENFDAEYCGGVEPPPDPDWTDDFPFVISDETGQNSTVGFGFGPGETAGEGDQFCVEMVSVDSGTFPGASVYLLPSMTFIDNLEDGAGSVCIFIQEGDTGLSIQWEPCPEGQICEIVFRKLGYNLA